MFLQNLYNWKPFRAIAALMLVLFMATACQETAQQVIQKSANAPVGQSEQSQETAVAQNTPLSEAELALVKKMEGDEDIAAMTKMQKIVLFKMKIAIGHDKEGFKQAILSKNSKKFVELMNFSESEYAEFSTKLQWHLANFKTRYAADMSTLENLQKRYAAVSKTSLGFPSSAAALDEQLAIIEKANIGNTEKTQVFDELECQTNRPNVYAAYLQGATIINGIFLILLPGASSNPLTLGALLTWWIASSIYLQCNTCGCPW